MAAIFANQLQPWEENQSPSPTEERTDPFSALQRARSGGSHKTPPSPSSPINSLHRQLSGDPDHPPPAWQRRSSFRDGKNPSRSPSKSISMSSASASPPLASGQTNNVGGNGMLPNQPVPPNMGGAAHGRTSRSPSDASSASGISGGARPNLPPQTRRHPHLTMTTSTPGLMGNELYSHDSPHGSSSSLHDPVLLPPNPAFAGKGSRGNRSASARSSMHTLNSMTSEELWDAEPDRSNPHRPSQERPLDTVRKDRRNSQASTRNSIMTTPAYQMDMMWPLAPPELEDVAMGGKRSKSTTNVQSLSRRSSRLTLSRKKRQSNVDIPGTAHAHPPSKANSILNSSANSSLTDIPGQKIHRNPSYGSLGGRPPSSFLYDSRSFLTQMAPLEGGYAIAAAINSPPQSQNNSPVASPTDLRHRGDAIRNSRPPVSRSAGMARWSLDGGEHYGSRSFGNVSSAASTTSNLAAPPINSGSGQPSPESEDMSSISMHSLPDGASPPVGPMGSVSMSPNASTDHSPPQNMVSSIPVNPSPLSQSVTKDQPLPKSGTQSTITSNTDGVVAPTPVPAAAADGTSAGRAGLPAGAATPIASGQPTDLTSSDAGGSDKGKGKGAAAGPEAVSDKAQAGLKGTSSAKTSAKDAKAAEKAEKVEMARKAKEAEEKRRAEWEQAQRAKAEQKAREKEEKKKTKKDKGGLSGLFGLGGGKKGGASSKGSAQTGAQAQAQGQARDVSSSAAARPPQVSQQQATPHQQPQPQQPRAQPSSQQAPVGAVEARQAAPARPAPVRQDSGQRPPAERIPSSTNIYSPPPAPAGQSTARQNTKPFPAARPASQLMPPAPAATTETRQRGTGSLPSDARAPRPAPAPAGADSHKDEKKKLGFFGTIRRRFSSNPSTAAIKSVQKAEQKPPVPPMPANVGSVRSQAGAAGLPPPPAPATPATQTALPMTPPKMQAVAKPITGPAPVMVTPDGAPVASADLPPRSTSVRGSPANVAPTRLDSSPLHQGQGSPAPSQEGEVGNRNGIPTSPSPLSRARGSIKGPRPMPRPASAASGSRSVRSASVSAASPKPEGEHDREQPHTGSNANANSPSPPSFPFHKPSADHAGSNGTAALNEREHEHAGTESSGLSQVPSHFTSSDGTGVYDVLATPMSSEEEAYGHSNGVGLGQVRDRVHVQLADAVSAQGQGSEDESGGLSVLNEAVQGKKELGTLTERDGSGDTVRAVVA